MFSLSGGGVNESYLRDEQNSTVAITSSSGSIVDQPTYDPWGNTTDTHQFGYIGREQDVSGLYYMRGRYYYAPLQRFISRDPIGIAGDINMYAYAGDDPVDFSDPMGTDAYEWIGAGYVLFDGSFLSISGLGGSFGFGAVTPSLGGGFSGFTGLGGEFGLPGIGFAGLGRVLGGSAILPNVDGPMGIYAVTELTPIPPLNPNPAVPPGSDWRWIFFFPATIFAFIIYRLVARLEPNGF